VALFRKLKLHREHFRYMCRWREVMCPPARIRTSYNEIGFCNVNAFTSEKTTDVIVNIVYQPTIPVTPYGSLKQGSSCFSRPSICIFQLLGLMCNSHLLRIRNCSNNHLQPNGNYVSHLFQQSAILHFVLNVFLTIFTVNWDYFLKHR
jgi:hypothetical protein